MNIVLIFIFIINILSIPLWYAVQYSEKDQSVVPYNRYTRHIPFVFKLFLFNQGLQFRSKAKYSRVFMKGKYLHCFSNSNFWLVLNERQSKVIDEFLYALDNNTNNPWCEYSYVLDDVNMYYKDFEITKDLPKDIKSLLPGVVWYLVLSQIICPKIEYIAHKKEKCNEGVCDRTTANA